MVNAPQCFYTSGLLLWMSQSTSYIHVNQKIKTMEVLIMFIVFAIGFAWAWPEEEIEELDKRLGKKK